MNPADFHKTAELLKNRKEEWHVRTSINRSYYGLFLYLREFLTDKEVRLPDRNRKSHHQFVLECFHKSRFFQDNSEKNCKNPEKKPKPKDSTIFGIYSRLKTLLQRRTDADYKLHLVFRVNDSEDSLRLATTTVQDFEKLHNSEREKHIINTAKCHAQEIIRN